MKVRISYAVGIEDVPEKISNLLEKVSEESYKVQGEIENCIKTSEVDSNSLPKYDLLRENIENLKSKILDLDQVINDASSILDGYIGFLNPEPSETEEKPQKGAPNAD